MKVLAIDYGTKRCGLAVGDRALGIAHPLTTLKRDDEFIENLKDILLSREIEEVLVGLPLNTDGSISKMAKRAIEFAHTISEQLKIPVKLVDERFTTNMANSILKEEDISSTRRKKKVDKISASLILQLYLSNPSIAKSV